MEGGPRFIIFGDVIKGYWWRLRSAQGATIESSGGRRHYHKSECEREVQSLKDERYPLAMVCDTTMG